ncbi:MAG: MBL fold metallo-hydrolase [Cyclobacteriaceae bacterium]|nr:MBL fold metallo-hydrolase [Cyclobacteriaceae bacterium]
MRVLVFLLALPFTLHAQMNFDTVKIRPFRLADNLYMLTGTGGNLAALTGKEGNLIVDDQYAPLSDKIRQAVYAINPGEVRYVINTHLHGDHTGGNENFRRVGATLVAHDNVRARMMKESVNREGKTVPPRNPESWPVVTFQQRLSVHLNGEDLELHYLDRGHTDGDVVVRFRNANVIHTGDAFVRERYPFIDLTSGGSFLGYVHTLEQIYSLADDQTKIIPGHGALAMRADVKALHDKLADIRDQVIAALQKGTKPEDLATLPIATKYDAEFGKGFVKGKDFVLLVADEVKGMAKTRKK